jgi:hypothetical protein
LRETTRASPSLGQDVWGHTRAVYGQNSSAIGRLGFRYGAVSDVADDPWWSLVLEQLDQGLL